MHLAKIARPHCTIVYENGERFACQLDTAADADPLPFRFWRDALRLLVQDFQADDLQFFIVDRETTPLPGLSADVVVLIFADEIGRIVPYARDVRAVFKSFGTRPALPSFASSPLRRIVDRSRFCRDWAIVSSAAARQAWHGYTPVTGNVYPIPPSYDVLGEAPDAGSFLDRRYAVSFFGSVRHTARSRLSPGRLIGRPKDLARRAMVEALHAYDQQRQKSDILVADTGSFANSIALGREGYTAIMRDTMIAAVPRGIHPETHRLYEALSAGCIVVSEPLPKCWYLTDSPIIELPDWSHAGRVLDPILADKPSLLARHRASQRYWRDRLAPNALAHFIARTLGLAPHARASNQSTRATLPSAIPTP